MAVLDLWFDVMVVCLIYKCLKPDLHLFLV